MDQAKTGAQLRIARERGTRVFFLRGVHPSGRRFRRSTGTTDMAVALAILVEEARARAARGGFQGQE